MAMFERVHMPAFAGAAGWLNSEPPGPAELRGRVVLVNFWPLTSINAMSTDARNQPQPFAARW